MRTDFGTMHVRVSFDGLDRRCVKGAMHACRQ